MEVIPYDESSEPIARKRATISSIVEAPITSTYQSLKIDENILQNPHDLDALTIVTCCFGVGLFLLYIELFTSEGQCNMRMCHGQDVVKPMQMDIIDSMHGSCCQGNSNDCSIDQTVPCMKSTIRAMLTSIGSYCDFAYQSATTNDTMLAIHKMLTDGDFRMLKDHQKPVCFNHFAQTCSDHSFGFQILVACVVFLGQCL